MLRAYTIITRGIVFLLLLAAFITVLGTALGSPMGVSYVETNSMEPTLSPSDGFILVPDDLTDSPEQGDIVVFRAERLGGGGLTTHRVVGETDRGYITQGDNNNAPDQEGDEPPVQQAQIVGQPLYVGDQVVVLPYVGSAAAISSDLINGGRGWLDSALWQLGIDDPSSQHRKYAVAALLMMLYGLDSLRERGRDHQSSKRNRRGADRSRDDQHSVQTILVVLTAVLIVSTTAAMVVPSGTQQYGIVALASDGPHEAGHLASTGEKVEFTHGMGNSPILPMVVLIQGGDGVSVDRQQAFLARGEIANVSTTISVPPSIGYYQFYVLEHWYIPILPTELITALYRVHPWLPLAVINALIGVPFYILSAKLVGTGRIRVRSRKRDLSILSRLRQVFRYFY